MIFVFIQLLCFVENIAQLAHSSLFFFQYFSSYNGGKPDKNVGKNTLVFAPKRFLLISILFFCCCLGKNNRRDPRNSNRIFTIELSWRFSKSSSVRSTLFMGIWNFFYYFFFFLFRNLFPPMCSNFKFMWTRTDHTEYRTFRRFDTSAKTLLTRRNHDRRRRAPERFIKPSGQWLSTAEKKTARDKS